MEEQLEQNLAATATSGDHTSAPQAPDPAIKTLDAGPLELTPEQKEQADKEYKGEFYPVVKSIHKKKDD
jgi:hypothetical protein